jgi:Xaa-Pro aminopeptidase
MLAFETITMAPIDRHLVDKKLLTNDEIAWLDAYHAKVREALLPKADSETVAFIEEATKPI